MDAMKLMNKLLEGCNSVVDEPAMPEVILPCPACGSTNVYVRGSSTAEPQMKEAA